MRHPNTFQQLTQDLLRVSNVCLNICVKGFHAPEMRSNGAQCIPAFWCI